MSTLTHLPLRAVLWIDAIAFGVTGLLALVAAGPLADLLDLPPTLLHATGAFLIPFVVYLVVLATRDVVRRAGVRVVVAVNLAWVAGSVLLLVSGQFDPSALGYAFVVAQAAAVALIAELQATALGQERRGGQVNHSPA